MKCPKCGNDDAMLLETTIYGQTRVSVFCNVCAHDWNQPLVKVVE